MFPYKNDKNDNNPKMCVWNAFGDHRCTVSGNTCDASDLFGSGPTASTFYSSCGGSGSASGYPRSTSTFNNAGINKAGFNDAYYREGFADVPGSASSKDAFKKAYDQLKGGMSESGREGFCGCSQKQ
jgi:hypothetical protein